MKTEQIPLIEVAPSFVPIGQRARGLSRKQSAIVDYLRKNGTITLQQATLLVGGDVYHNQAKHTGAILSNMVGRKIIKRIKAGHFSL